MTPLISVLLPVYNAEKFLAQSLESIRFQTFSDFEVVAIDDGSTDESLSIMEGFSERDSRFKISSRENFGLIYTLNELINNSYGKYLVRMDSDDICFPDRFEKQLNLFVENPDLGICGTNFVTIQSDGRGYSSDPDVLTAPADLEIASRFYTSLRHPSIMMDREVLGDELYYDANYPCAEDFDLFRRVAATGRLQQIPEPLLAYRLHTGSVSQTQAQTMARTHLRILEENMQRFYPEAAGTGIDGAMDVDGPEMARRFADFIRRLDAIADQQPPEAQRAFQSGRRTTFYFLYTQLLDSAKIDSAAAFLDACDGWSMIRRREWPVLKMAPAFSAFSSGVFRGLRWMDQTINQFSSLPADQLVPGYRDLASPEEGG